MWSSKGCSKKMKWLQVRPPCRQYVMLYNQELSRKNAQQVSYESHIEAQHIHICVVLSSVNACQLSWDTSPLCQGPAPTMSNWCHPVWNIKPKRSWSKTGTYRLSLTVKYFISEVQEQCALIKTDLLKCWSFLTFLILRSRSSYSLGRKQLLTWK